MKKKSDAVGRAAGRHQAVRNVARITGAYLALLIGSGFATGQEVMQYFVGHGVKGLAAMSVFLVLGTYLTVTMLLLGQKHGFGNNEQIFRHYAGRLGGTLFSLYAVVSLYCVYFVMLSAAGSVLGETYGTPVWVGALVMGLTVLGTLYFGLREIVAVLGTLGPVLILLLIVIALVAIARDPAAVAEGARVAPTVDMLRISDSWWLSGLLYPALVATGIASFMPPLGAPVESRRQLIAAGILAPCLFVLTLALIALALFSGMPGITGYRIPMLELASQTLPIVATVFSIIVTIGIFTTAVPLLWITLVRFSVDGSRRYHQLALVLTALGIVCATIMPFDRLLNIVFETIGYSGILMFVLVIARQLRDRALA